MKSGKGARKHEQAVPWQQEAGTAPGRWQIPNPKSQSPPSPRQPPGPSPALPAGRSLGPACHRGKALGKLVDVALGETCWSLVGGGTIFLLDGWEGALGAGVAVGWHSGRSHPIIPSH